MALTRVRATKNLTLNRFEAENEIDEAARQIRARFATEGKHTVYFEKRAEAERYLAALSAGTAPELTLDEYPYLTSEVGITAANATDLCELWLYMDRIWKPVAATIEQITMGAKAEIKAANSPADIELVVKQAKAYLDTIGDRPPERPKPSPQIPGTEIADPAQPASTKRAFFTPGV